MFLLIIIDVIGAFVFLLVKSRQINHFIFQYTIRYQLMLRLLNLIVIAIPVEYIGDME